MDLNGFTLKKYRKTVGREGEGFTANLVYRNRALVQYEDFGDGFEPNVRAVNAPWAQKELLSTVQDLHRRIPIPYLEPESLESCAKTMAVILDELRDMEAQCRKLSKMAEADSYLAITLTGDGWTVIVPDFEQFEFAQLFATIMHGLSNQEAAWERAAAYARKLLVEKQAQKVQGLYVFPANLPNPFSLNVEDYVGIFKGRFANELK